MKPEKLVVGDIFHIVDHPNPANRYLVARIEDGCYTITMAESTYRYRPESNQELILLNGDEYEREECEIPL